MEHFLIEPSINSHVFDSPPELQIVTAIAGLPSSLTVTVVERTSNTNIVAKLLQENTIMWFGKASPVERGCYF